MVFYNKLLRCNIFLAIIILSALCSKAQEIKGKVTDAESGKPIANASIYLNGTFKGTTSDKEGGFTLKSPNSNIPLIISCIGYNTVEVTNYKNADLVIKLNHRVNRLNEVTIRRGGFSREDEMKIFLEQFLGSISSDCTISNQDDIAFTYHRKTRQLIARSDKPLQINNKKLGYHITYFLSQFSHVPGEVFFTGNYFFAEDTSGLKPKDIKKIAKAREDVYFGSRMHFIRALWADNLIKEGFFIYNTEGDSIHYKDIIVNHDGQKFIALKSKMKIDYDKEQISGLQQTSNVKEIIIDSNGLIDPHILWSGDMGTQRVNKLLPFEYYPVHRQGRP